MPLRRFSHMVERTTLCVLLASVGACSDGSQGTPSDFQEDTSDAGRGDYQKDASAPAPYQNNVPDASINMLPDASTAHFDAGSVYHPPTETCNSMDDDGDGLTDRTADGTPLQQLCYTGPELTQKNMPCKMGYRLCMNGTYTGPCLDEIIPHPELCGNGIDDNCDGKTDEDYLGDVCEVDPSMLMDMACHFGRYHCLSGQEVCISEPIFPYEICDGRDNNCNGVIDEGTDQNVCGTCGYIRDVCDGLDNDCDGVTDNIPDSWVRCYNGLAGTIGIGECHDGAAPCHHGMISSQCLDEVIPQRELCDGLDNDCDGLTDEDFQGPVWYDVIFFADPSGSNANGYVPQRTAEAQIADRIYGMDLDVYFGHLDVGLAATPLDYVLRDSATFAAWVRDRSVPTGDNETFYDSMQDALHMMPFRAGSIKVYVLFDNESDPSITARGITEEDLGNELFARQIMTHVFTSRSEERVKLDYIVQGNPDPHFRGQFFNLSTNPDEIVAQLLPHIRDPCFDFRHQSMP